jgi:pyruvate/2-oxoglutarate dehydrogenase complex dihydrolipoamide acyltransferase (E2) component
MAYLCLSYDHRLIDGAYAGAFLNHMQSNLERFDFATLP